jgi:hypothetical protein
MKALACAALLALCLLPKLAAAAPLGATIRVERGERADDCPDAPELTRAVERILQRSLSEPSGSDELEVEVSFTSGRDEYAAVVRSLGPKPGERRLADRGKSCTALAQAVSVAIALLLDKELERRTSAASDGAPDADAASDANGAGNASSATNAAPAASQRATPTKKNSDSAAEQSSFAGAGTPGALAFRAAVEGGASAGLVAATTPLLSEELGLRVHGFVADVGFNVALPEATHFREGSVRTTLLFGSARACYLWGERISLGPCAGVGIGRLSGDGIGYPAAAAQSVTWTAASAGVLAEVPVWGRVFLGASGELWLPTRRSSFSVQNLGTAWESSTFAGSLALRLGFRIW